MIADYVAGRLGIEADDLLPRTVGQVSLALTLSAYTDWLDDLRPRAARPARQRHGGTAQATRPALAPAKPE